MQRTASIVCRSLAVIAAAAPLIWSTPAAARERQLLDADWKFLLGDDPAASRAEFDDGAWRDVDLPHDWSIEGAIDAKAPSENAGGYFPTGVGWYRRTFKTPEGPKGQRVAIEFEGVYRNAEVWVNGHSLGRHAYGYTPFRFDLTPHLNAEGPNVLAVRVDNSVQPNSRWYSGSGIYRHVWLEAVEPIHLVRDELFVTTTSASADLAALKVRTALENSTDADQSASVEIELFAPDGTSALTLKTDGGIAAGATVGGEAGIAVRQPRLWSPESPAMYRLVARVRVDNRVVDEVDIPVGIRTVAVSAEQGFELNGQSLKLIGGCVHHDNGPLGAAAFDRAEERRVELLKTAGFNAIRTSHNPPSTAFLAACDRHGMLVIDEAFDGWVKLKMPKPYLDDFETQWQAELEAFIRRDRNHPSVVMWSIGNEMFERAEESGAKLAAEMAAVVRRLDDTRPVTAACNHVDHDEERWRRVDRVFAPLDVAGYNYQLDVLDADHERLPNRIVAATESFPHETFRSWDRADSRAYFIGDFVWTALDYLGESGLGRVFAPGEHARDPWVGAPQFPSHGAPCGDIDLTGWRKPNSHYRNIVWDRGQRLYASVIAPAPDGGQWQLTRWSQPPALPSWTWPGAEGRELEIVVYSRHDAVRLYLNGALVGEQPTGRDQEFKAVFKAPYAAGELRAVGVAGGVEAEEFTLTTAGEAAQIRLTPDRADIAANGQDLAFVTVEITDADGRLRPDATVPVTYELTGPGKIIAIGSGDLTSIEPYHANPRRAFQGRAIVVVRTTAEAGEIVLRATAEGLPPTSTTVTTTGR